MQRQRACGLVAMSDDEVQGQGFFPEPGQVDEAHGPVASIFRRFGVVPGQEG